MLTNLRSSITLGLIVWFAGAGCMLVSYAHGASMTADESVSAISSKANLGKASGSAEAHNCCKARHSSERRIASSVTRRVTVSESSANPGELEGPNSSNAVSCCPLNSGTFVVNGRQRISNDNASVVRGVDAVSLVTGSAETSSANETRLPDQNRTYLRDCVFLI